MRGRTPPDLFGAEIQDQAAGLRRMFGERPPQVIAFATGDEASGRTQLLVGTAIALADAGQKVVLVDECPEPGNAISELGASVRGDLWDALFGRFTLNELVTAAHPNLWVLSAHGLIARVSQDSPEIREKMASLLAPLSASANFVLINSHFPKQGHLSPLSSTAPHMALVIGAQGESIRDAYALIKRLATERGRNGFQVVISRAKSEQMARTIFENMKRTTHEHLGVRVDLLGSVKMPSVDNLADALRNRLPLAVRNP